MKLAVSLISAVLVAGDTNQTVTCDSGYLLHNDGGKYQNETICRDVNECVAGGCLGPAANFCENTPGSFKCSCSSGYTLQSDGQTCTDDDECADNPCNKPFFTECTNTPGSYTCTCITGYSFNSTSGSCEDDDECDDANICDQSVTKKENQECNNNPGSYSCDCKSGYSADAEGLCQDINECDTANICGRGTCVNDPPGSYKCECSGFWQVDPKNATLCIDVDECTKHTDNCHDPDKKAARRDNCVNEEEGWRCDCEVGYMENSKGECVDLDECATGGDNCDTNAKCTNIVMKDGDHYFTCECNEGYSGNGTHCEDIDECNPNKCGDGAKCTNLIGKYSCSCTAGWRDDPNDPDKCVDIDECDEGSYTCNEFGKSVCANTAGGYKCVCAAGYQGAGDACFDINECTAGTHKCVSNNSTCHNTDGSHYCTCDDGYTGDATKSFQSCADDNECADDHSLCLDKENMFCENNDGSYECKCKAGWRPNDKGGCDDVNECWINNFSGCGGQNKGVCSNTVGSFTCACNKGYKMEADGSCANFDECAAKIVPEICHLDAVCTDTDGGFKCTCPDGFLGDGQLCSNKNECVDNSHKCSSLHTCKDTHGSYTCECAAGYKLNEEKNDCVDKNECAGEGVYSCGGKAANPLQGKCVNNVGSYECACNPMTTADGNGKCVDNNECLDGSSNPRTDVCQGDNEQCDNVLPSVNKAGFQCVCKDGFERNGDGACVDIDDCKAALENDSNCANPDNAAHFGCRDTGVNSYKCECLAGYKQDVAVTDSIKCDNVDECKDGYDCSGYNDANRMACTDTDGSYECGCNDGYSMGDDGKCSNTNECFLGTHNCPAVGGKCEDLKPASKTDPGFQCTCEDGYDEDTSVQGVFKCNDHNECTDGSSNACLGSNGAEMCFNKNMHDDGMKYECGCKLGYHKLDGASECTNKNECRGEGVHSCLEPNKSKCKDTDGSYVCECATGFIADGDKCKDVDECDVSGPTHGCSADGLCNNIPGSYECACKPGYDGDGRICSDINECEMADNGCPVTNGKCKDTVGSYECTCQDGYKHPPSGCAPYTYTPEDVADGKTGTTLCTDDAFCTNAWGNKYPRCDSSGNCFPKLGTNMGDKIVACTGVDTSKCVNIDECTDTDYAYDCNQGDANRNKCRDTVGGFECDCDSGYKFGESGNCTDIDECASDKHPCHENAKCQNKEGQAEGVFTCVCDAGYKGNGTFCEDDNECGAETCETFQYEIPHMGMGEPGGASCVTDADCDRPKWPRCHNSACFPPADAVQHTDYTICSFGSSNVCGANAACTNSIGSYQCTCNLGFRAGDPKKGEAVCVDLDECDFTQGVYSCPENNSCKNNEGSYECVCSTGFQECTAAGSVAPKCNLTTSQVGDCTNVNECSDGNNGGCGTETYNLCVDTAGSFYCDCADGWTMQKDDQGVNKCVNINECEEKDNACPDPKSTCKDTEGSYNCPCSDGWKEDNQQCVDINECADPDYPYDCPNKLQSVCRNTVGGFECDCDVGTMWNTTTNGCTDLNECETQDIKCGEFSQCVNMVLRDGTIIKDEKGNALYKCTCAPGYFGNGLLCSNKNECKDDNGADTNICGVGGVCTDNDGSYSCSCATNYMNNEENSGCVDRNECSGDGTYDCGNGEDPNRGQCKNKDDGYDCVCNPGFTEIDHPTETGKKLCQDNNECTATGANKHTCDKNADCTNIDGSFTCKCKYGYSGSGQDGDCTDIDECKTLGASACPNANSECKNYDGRHDCPCVAGYKESGGKCVDRDECTDNTNECSVNANCHNTVGGYTCTCHGEYEGDGKTCLMCPSDRCWRYDEGSKACKIKADGNCTEVDCDATSMTVRFAGELFGLSDELATWASDAQPTYADVVNSTLDWSYTSDLGANGMTYVMTADKKIKFKMLIALSGTQRARSDFDLVVARQIDLGSKTLLTTPFGIGVMYTCSYPLSVDIQSSNFTAQVVSQQGQKDGMGSLAAGFEMKLNDLGPNDPFEFILGAILKIGVSWGMPDSDGLLDSLSFWLDSCYVSHGSKDIYVVKNGCFANALEVKDLEGDTSRSAAFNYKLFKGVGENSATQSITCCAKVCDTAVTNSTLPGYCGKPTNSTSQCPKAGDDIYYDFKAGVGCIDGCV